MADQGKDKKPRQTATEPGRCPRCGLWLDDHDGWLTKGGPRCPTKRGK